MAFLSNPESKALRRRLLVLALFVVMPVLVLAAIAARSLRYETLAAREDALHQAEQVTEWVGAQSISLYFPVLDLMALLGGQSLAELQQSTLLRPARVEEDLVVRLAQVGSFGGRRVQACLLDREGSLVYPVPAGSPERPALAGLQSSHDLSRALYRKYAEPRDNDVLPAGNLVRVLKLEEVWYVWRLEQREAGYQILFAMPEKEFLALATELLDPRRAGLFTSLVEAPSTPRFARRILTTTQPFKDYMQVVTLFDDSKLIVHIARPDAPVITQLNAVGGRLNERSQLSWAEQESPRILSERASGVSYVGPWAPVRLRPDRGSTVFRFVVSVHSQKLLLAHVRRQKWIFAGLIGLACVGTGLGLRSGWRTLHEEARLSAAKSNFISSVSHELRTPLASVRLMVEGLQRGSVTSPAKVTEYHRLIDQECRRVSGLVENVLDLSRIEQGRKTYTMEWCQIDQLCRETVTSLQPVATAADVRLNLLETGEPRALRCDAGAIQQVLVNLVDNAIKHSPAHGHVEVSADFGPSELRLAVSDQGPGIPPADRAWIFEPFRRRGSELRRETTGLGLGLAIVKHALDAHRGTVSVEDNQPQGARFVVVLPIEADSHQAVPAAS